VVLYSICIATYQRPVGLLALLKSVEAQLTPDNTNIEVIVVDNDPRSAEVIVKTLSERSRFELTYLTQPEPNIAVTRNVGVAAASGEFVWFIDDDETADPRCLWHLIEAQQRFDADVVFGRVLPMFESETPEWIRSSSSFIQRAVTTGQSAVSGGTSNTLVRRSALAQVEGPFDREFGLTGGSDSLLFRKLNNLGCTLIYARESIVRETIPAERATWQWMKDRTQRQGLNYGRQVILTSSGRTDPVVLRMLLSAIVQLPGSLALSVLTWASPNRRREFQLRARSNFGKIQGFFGVTLDRTPDTPQSITDR